MARVNHKWIVAALIGALGICAHAQAADKVTLALKLEKGSVYEAEFTSNVNQSTTLHKSEVKQDTSTTVTAQMAVEDVAAGGVMTLRVTYKSMKLEVANAASSMKGDSTHSKLTTPADKICVAILGKSFTMDIDPLGNVVKVAGVKELVEGVADALASEGGQPKSVTIAQLAPMFNEASLAQQFGAGLRIFPDHPVAVGDSWVIKSPAADGAIPLSSESTLKLQGVNGSAIITSENSIATPADHKGNIGGEITIMNLKGNGSATIEVDLKTGMTLKTSSSSQVGGTLTIKSPDGKTSEDCQMSVKTSTTGAVRPAK